tara:strand:- start:430 stop:858 length:429 start_codon:yes stop_codon:yes gene_type:complete
MIDMFSIVLTVLFLVGLAAFSYLVYFWIEHRLKVRELDELLTVVLEDVKAADAAFQDYQKSSDKMPLDQGSDKYLSTLITVITKKLDGEVVLTADDFERVSLDDYVTLYIDTNTYNIVLRTQNNDMSEISSYFNSKDEDVFH